MERGRIADVEIPFDPTWSFWNFRLEILDENGDPLDLLLRAEEGDEVALAILEDRA